MIHITDEMLMAYLDGEVSLAEVAVVKEALLRDKDLQARLDRLSKLQTQVRDALDTMELGAPAPALSALVARPRSVSFWRRANAGSWRLGAIGASLLAACLAIVVAIPLIKGSSAEWIEPVEDGVALSGGVNSIAMKGLSGKDYRVGEMVVSPILSFVSQDRRICRELSINSKDLNARLIVCRADREDDWCFEAFSRTHPPADATHPYAAAGREPDSIIEAAYARLKVARELDLSDERAAISSKWERIPD